MVDPEGGSRAGGGIPDATPPDGLPSADLLARLANEAYRGEASSVPAGPQEAAEASVASAPPFGQPGWAGLGRAGETDEQAPFDPMGLAKKTLGVTAGSVLAVPGMSELADRSGMPVPGRGGVETVADALGVTLPTKGPTFAGVPAAPEPAELLALADGGQDSPLVPGAPSPPAAAVAGSSLPGLPETPPAIGTVDLPPELGGGELPYYLQHLKPAPGATPGVSTAPLPDDPGGLASVALPPTPYTPGGPASQAASPQHPAGRAPVEPLNPAPPPGSPRAPQPPHPVPPPATAVPAGSPAGLPGAGPAPMPSQPAGAPPSGRPGTMPAGASPEGFATQASSSPQVVPTRGAPVHGGPSPRASSPQSAVPGTTAPQTTPLPATRPPATPWAGVTSVPTPGAPEQRAPGALSSPRATSRPGTGLTPTVPASSAIEGIDPGRAAGQGDPSGTTAGRASIPSGAAPHPEVPGPGSGELTRPDSLLGTGALPTQIHQEEWVGRLGSADPGGAAKAAARTARVPAQEPHLRDLPNELRSPEVLRKPHGLGHEIGYQVPDAAPPMSHPAPAGLDVVAVRKDFPILQQRVHGKPLAWLDNAATTQKPRAVIERLARFYETENSNVHRAAHAMAARATNAYEEGREKVQRFLNAGSAREIIFVRGCTEAVNLVANTFGQQRIGEGDEIVLTTLEHHSNIVPWQMLAARTGARIRVAPVNDRGEILLDEYAKLLGQRTRLVAMTHVSNALGTILPVQAMTEMAHRHGARVLIDGAQSVPHLAVDVQALGADFYAFSGHKIFAPTGIGVLYGKKELLDEMPPWQGGGNMIEDVRFEQTVYQETPMKFEAGTGILAGAAGLGAAIDYVNQVGLANIERWEHQLLQYGTEALRTIPGLRLVGTAAEKASVMSFVLDGVGVEEVGSLLDREGIAVRAGHHCAQPTMRRFGLEGTVRPSLAFYNDHEDVDRLIHALRRIREG